MITENQKLLMKNIFLLSVLLPLLSFSQLFVDSGQFIYISNNSFVSSKMEENKLDSIFPISNAGILFLNDSTKIQSLDANFIPKLTQENPFGIGLTNNDLHISENLHLNSGIFQTNNQLLHIHNTASISGSYSNAIHINGWVRKYGNTAFMFPIGDSNIYAPISITAPSNASDHFTATYFNASPNFDYPINTKQNSINHVSNCEYWMLNRTGGTSNVNVTLSYEYSRSCGVNDLATLKVVRWDGSQWTDEHGSANGTDTLSGTFTSQTISNFSPFTFGSGSPLNPLPVSLSYFKSKCNNKNLVLEWATASEINNKQFDLYFSKDATNWIHLTTINSQGDAAFTQKYEFKNPDDNGYYYKLEQTDFESTAETLQIIKSNCSPDQEKNIIILYPNPVDNELFIQNLVANLVQIEFYDLNSRLVLTYKTDKLKDLINLSELSKGTYLVKIISQNETFWNKIIKQ